MLYLVKSGISNADAACERTDPLEGPLVAFTGAGTGAGAGTGTIVTLPRGGRELSGTKRGEVRRKYFAAVSIASLKKV